MIVEAVKNRPVNIGRLGENEARIIRFPVDDLQNEFPGCTFLVLHRRKHDESAYPVPSENFTVESGRLYWTVKSGDVAQEGSGECQISAILDSKIMKTDIYMTIVGRALDGSGDPPDPWQGWVEQVEEAAETAVEAANNASKIVVVSTEQPDEPLNKLWIKDQAEQEYTVPLYSEHQALEARVEVLEPAAASGDVGKVLKAKAVEDGKVTEYELEGIPDYAMIDDTAGAGDTNKAWSADKLTSELDLKAQKANPAFTGSVSLSRKANTVTGQNSTATGYNVEASGDFSNANGYETRAKNKSQNVFGEYNVPDTSSNPASGRGDYVEIVGNGLRSDSRSNARVLDWNGNERLMGNLYVGCNADGTGGTKAAKITEIPNANGPTAIQNYEGDVYDVGTLNNNLKVSVPYKRFEVKSGSGLDDFTIKKQIDGKTVNVHFLSNDGVVSVAAGEIGTAYEGMILVGTVQGYQLPPNDPQYQNIVNAYRLFNVASTTETQAIITEYAEVSA